MGTDESINGVWILRRANRPCPLFDRIGEGPNPHFRTTPILRYDVKSAAYVCFREHNGNHRKLYLMTRKWTLKDHVPDNVRLGLHVAGPRLSFFQGEKAMQYLGQPCYDGRLSLNGHIKALQNSATGSLI